MKNSLTQESKASPAVAKEQDLLHWPGSPTGQMGMVQGAARLGDHGSPAEIRFEGRCRGKIVNRANGRNDRRRGDWPEAWKRQQDLPLAGGFDDAHNFAFQLLHMLTQKTKFCDQLTLFQHEATKTRDILDATALRSQSRQFQELGIGEGTGTSADLLKGSETGGSQGLGRGKAPAERKSEERIGIFHDPRQIGKDLIA